MELERQRDEENRRAEIAKAEHAQSFWSLVWEQFRTHRAAVLGLSIILFYVLVAVGAPVISWITGLDPEAQNPLNRYLKPQTYAALPTDKREEIVTRFQTENPELADRLRKEIVAKNLITVVREEDALFDLANKEPDEMKTALAGLQTEGSDKLRDTFAKFQTFHVFGTDELGRDVFIRLVYGTRVSMGVGILVALASAIIGLLIGAFAGYYGGWIDNALMRFTDALLSLPTTPLLIVVSAISVDKVPGLRTIITESNENIMKLVFILVLFSWMTVARLVRAEVLSLREREFVLAARTLGGRDSQILLKHLFPNVIAPLLVSVTLGIGESIQFEAALSFLGLGIQQPTPSWGNMLFNAQDLIQDAPFLAILPGTMILIVTISFNYLGDGLQDAINPKSVRR
jgi:peptide/nickel transport system permease protein